MSWQNKGLNIRKFIETCGSAEGAAMELRTILEDEKDGPVIMNEFSLRECAEQLKRPGFENATLRHGHLSEAVQVSQFSIIVGELISNKVMDSYNAYPKILDRLVAPFPSKLQIDKIPGTYVAGVMEDVLPGEPYKHTGDIKDKYVQIEGKKRGMILDITEEAVMFDQTGTILYQAGKFGELAAIDREKRGLYTIMDLTVAGKTYYCWYPAGTRTAVWANAGGAGHAHEYDNMIVDVLADYTDIDVANLLLGTMRDENGNNILVPATQILVPRALLTTATRLIKNSVLPGGTNEERNPYADAVEVLHSPIIDGCGDTDAIVNWWWGDFKRQFINKVVYPLQTLRRRMSDNHDPAFEQDMIAQYKVREYSQVGAVDYRYVVKSTGHGS